MLRIHADHLQDRAAARDATLDELRDFDPAEWELMTVEVRADEGTFVRTAWRRDVDGRTWWIVIGYRDTITSVYPAERAARKLGSDVVRAGDAYQFLATVNAALMKRDVPDHRGLDRLARAHRARGGRRERRAA